MTLQLPMACPQLVTHTLAELCALWLPSAPTSPENLHKQTKPQPLQTTGLALPQPPVQVPPRLLHTAKVAPYLAVAHGMPTAGHSHTGKALCVVVAKCCPLFCKLAKLHFHK